MQTFLPYVSFFQSARALDNARLKKQRLEVLQILRALEDPDAGYQFHPAVMMWHGYEYALCTYGLACCHVWRIERGFDCNLYGEFQQYSEGSWIKPGWLGDKDFHRSHRSRLMEKKPDFYYWPKNPENMPYLWPVNKSNLSMRHDYSYDLSVSKADLYRLDTDERVLPNWIHLDNHGIVRYF